MIGVTRLAIAATVLASAVLGGWTYRHRTPNRSASERQAGRIDPSRLPNEAGQPALLAFTSPLCVACQRTPGLVAEALDVGEDELTAGQAPIELAKVDVTERGDLAKALDVRRTPTLAGVGPEGHVRFVHEGNPDPEALAGRLRAWEVG